MDEEHFKSLLNSVYSVTEYLNNFGRQENKKGMKKSVEIIISSCFSCPHFKYEYSQKEKIPYGHNCELAERRIVDDPTGRGDYPVDLIDDIMPDWCPLPDADEVAQ